MGNKAGRKSPAYGYGDPYLNQYGAGYGYGGQPGLSGYGRAGYGYTVTTPGGVYEEPWQETDWTSYYIPTVGGRQKRPVIYVAAPMPAAPSNPCAGFGGGLPMGGLSGGLPMGGLGGGLPMGGCGGLSMGGLGGGLPMGGLGGGLPMGGFGGGLPMGGCGGLGGNLGYQVLPMVTVAYGGGIPGVGGGFPGVGGGFPGVGGGFPGAGGGISPFGGGLPLF